MKIEQFLTQTQPKLARDIINRFTPLVPQSDITVVPDGFILIKGQAPIMLVAHLDTVHKTPVKDIFYSEDKNKLISPQGIGGDDRCGVYGIIKVWQNTDVKPWLLFTFDEEIGCIGAQIFAKYQTESLIDKDKIKAIVQIDRRGSDDAVFYDCNNPDFTKYILSKGFKEKQGSFSDISVIAPTMGVAAVNVSAGYYNEHSSNETIVLDELEATIKKVTQIVNESVSDDFAFFKYIPAQNTSPRPMFSLNPLYSDDEELDDVLAFLYEFFMDDEKMLERIAFYESDPIAYQRDICDLYQRVMDYINKNYDNTHNNAFFAQGD